MRRSVCHSACFAYSPPWVFLTASLQSDMFEIGVSKLITLSYKLFSVFLDNFWFSMISLNPLHWNFSYFYLGVEKELNEMKKWGYR